MVKKLAFFTENCQKRALYADWRSLRRDTNASRDRFQPMGASQNLALYYFHSFKKLNNPLLQESYLLVALKVAGAQTSPICFASLMKQRKYETSAR